MWFAAARILAWKNRPLCVIPPATPSPALSTASDSLASSQGPSTPPQPYPVYFVPIAQVVEYPTWEPIPPAIDNRHSRQSFSSSSADYPSVDPLLEALPSPVLPPLLWDIMTHPDNIRLGSAHSPRAHRLTSSDVARCAARSRVADSRLPLRTLIMVLPTIPLEVEIVPSTEPLWADMPLPYVTVGDVLHGLYRALRVPIKPEELGKLDPGRRELVRRSFERRLRDDPTNRARNLEYGIRRIDYLGHRRYFLGIRPARSFDVAERRKRSEVFIVELGHVS
ncbi:hypothetical protein BD414DRAFT_556148 [Trametes punicea]|nr:hypothetical protein BD414DRAFT_556148 [Trametes punicea]